MLLNRSLLITLAAALVLVGCGKKDPAEAALDKYEEASNEAIALVQQKKPTSMEEVTKYPEWKAIDDKGRAADSSLRVLEGTLTPEQRKRRDEITTRVMTEFGKVMPKTQPTPEPKPGDTSVPAPQTPDTTK